MGGMCVVVVWRGSVGKGGGMGGRERCNIRVESRLMVDGNLE